ncbi:probable rhamnogalacturonate lyase B [Diospyros lotus]|uniref:probable rhamnogalacturonate lyase B n=1 Tax=Diospyros lotus TaxID=55363 RepID=UPI00224DC069|nr:probable rhamnogalacturonate lyase B [Diospyros lotus]
MEKAGWKKKQWLFLCFVTLAFLACRFRIASAVSHDGKASPPARLHKLSDDYVVMDNGLVQVTLSTPDGKVTRIQYDGIENLLENNKESNRGYWDIVWSGQEGDGLIDHLEGTRYKIIAADENQIEISFLSTWNSSRHSHGRPLNVDKRFIMLRGSSGFYTYAIFERLEGWPAMTLVQARVAFKLQHKLFNYMAISDTRQRFMPSVYDRINGKELDYKEAVLLTDPHNQTFKGEVDDKYQYSADIKDNRLHGWISYNEGVGFWVITPNNEFRVGGPLKQELSSHVGPTSLAMFFSGHYAGPPVSLSFQDGESWKKVLGPVFIYINKASNPDHLGSTLWEDAKQQMLNETQSWPYSFPLSADYAHADQRAVITGRLLVRDRYINKELMNASSAYVGLAKPGQVRSWQTESKDYQFWTQADAEGHFVIKDVREGTYNLYAWVPGILGDYRYGVLVNATPGSHIRLGDLVYHPPRRGPTLWEIGIPDRTSAEFYIPEPDPDYINRLYTKSQKFRQYGLWDRYTDLHPDGDLVYTIGKSNYQKDWFFAHVTRRRKDNVYVPTTWRIVFKLWRVRSGSYTLHIALAASSFAELQLRINDQSRLRPHFTTRLIGRDNAIARHGIHGLYSLYSVEVPSYLLVGGNNTIYLTQSRGGSPFSGLMYDYIRFEGPPQTN